MIFHLMRKCALKTSLLLHHNLVPEIEVQSPSKEVLIKAARNLDIHSLTFSDSSHKSQQIIGLVFVSQFLRRDEGNQHDRKLSKPKRGIDDDCIVVSAMGGLIINTKTFP